VPTASREPVPVLAADQRQISDATAGVYRVEQVPEIGDPMS
jgi:hypothetical protein